MATNPIITLWGAQNIGLILLYPSGVRYENQAGGYMCLHPSEEGVYAPLYVHRIDQEAMLEDHFFRSPKWGGCCFDGIDHEDADVIDHILGLARETRHIKVDRSRLRDSCEAWIYVNVVTQADGNEQNYTSDIPPYPAAGFGECNGVLTWRNSD
jgi:Family of unknown function (DUF6210)